MTRPLLEVADIVRSQGDRFIQHNFRWFHWAHRKVLRAIARCRTASLGGHRDQCPRCGYRTTSYNSCLMESNLYWGVRSAWCHVLSA